MAENIKNGLEDDYCDIAVSKSEENNQTTIEEVAQVNEYDQLNFPQQESQKREFEKITLEEKTLQRKNKTKLIVGAVCFVAVQIVVSSLTATSLKFIFIDNLQHGLKDLQQDIKYSQKDIKDFQLDIKNLQQEIQQYFILNNNSINSMNSDISMLNTTIRQKAEIIYKLIQTLSNIAVGLALQDFKFNRSTLYKNVYISTDDRVLYNYRSEAELYKGFGLYRRSTGTKLFSQYDVIYYEIDFYFNPLFDFRMDTGDEWLEVLSIFGFSTLYLNAQLSEHTLQDYILIIAKYNANDTSLDLRLTNRANDSKKISYDTVNRQYKATFGFYVNGPKKQITCFERQENDLVELLLFTNIDFVKQIYPVFDIQNENFAVILSLKTGNLIKSVPQQLYEEILNMNLFN